MRFRADESVAIEPAADRRQALLARLRALLQAVPCYCRPGEPCSCWCHQTHGSITR